LPADVRALRSAGKRFVWKGTLGLLCVLACSAPVRAQEEPDPFAVSPNSSPFGGVLGRHYYAQLRKSPGKALLLDLALPGAGNVYTGLYANAAITGAVSLLGAALWIAGAARDHDGLWWSGAGVFAAGRAYGLVSAPVGAALLNAAFRRQFGLSVRAFSRDF
jgi:hypothetical protein